MLSQANSSPDFANYLIFIFSSQRPPQCISLDVNTFHTIRCAAAISLKNSLRTSYRSIQRPTQTYLRSAVLQSLQDPHPQIRNLAGNIITEITLQGGILDWPELLSELLSLVGNADGKISSDAQEGAMSALSKVCEDNRKVLDKDYQGQRPLNVIIPRLLEFTAHPNARIRSHALTTLKAFLPQKPQALLSSIDTFLTRLFDLANDPSPDVRQKVCQSFVQLVEIRPEKLVPHMSGLVEYTIIQQRDQEDPELALDAAEFWLAVGEHEQLRATLAPYLGKVIPLLLQSMVYGEDDILLLGGQEDDADEEDREEDLKPQFAKGKGVRSATKAGNGSSQNLLNGTNGAPNSTQKGMTDDDELSEGEVEDDDDDDDQGDPEDGWSLRKCSAAALDVFATVFHGPVFEAILPYLKDNLKHDQWPNREAAVLALGAVADGCMDAVTPHLPELVPYLISLLNDPEPVVRQITCWCLGRYSYWASHLKTPEEKSQFFEPMMEGILNKMLDNNKRVQEAAASAFANLEERAEAELIPYCEPILQQFVRCFSKYKDRNMFILYDCVQTLAEHVTVELSRPSLRDLLMSALIDRWNKVADQSREIFPLLECLGYVAVALGDNFSGFAAPIFQRCVKIIYQNLQDYMAAVNNQALDQPDKDFLVTSLDLLSSIIQAIDPRKSGELVSSSNPRFFDLLAFCMEDPSSDVRQSSYALVGDCAIHIFPQLRPYLPVLVPILIKQLDLDTIVDEDTEAGFSVLNNACWSCGEIALREKEGLKPYVENLYQGFIAIMKNEEVLESVNENAAIALGRLGIGCAPELAPHLQDFADPLLESMLNIDFTDEKVTAFIGFNKIIEKNPRALEQCLARYFRDIATFPSVLLQNHRPLLQSFQQVS
jgi:transportin-1